MPKATFRQNQFGGSIGAPLRRDRTFLFAAVEMAPTRASNVVTIEPEVASTLGAAGFPVQTGLVPYEQSSSELVVKGDHYWRPAHSLSVRVQVADLMNENYVPFGGLTAASRGARADRLDWGLAGSQTDVIGGRWVNEARLQVARQSFQALPFDAQGPSVTLLGVASAGRSDLHPTDRLNWSVQLKDTLTFAGQRHTFKAGLDALTIDQEALLSYNFGGAYTFAALPPIPGLLPTGLSALDAFRAGLPALYVQGYGDGESPFDYGELSLFAQDDWRVGSRLTLKGGLRYQHQGFPDFDVTVSNLAGTSLTYPFPLRGHHVSPRVAAALDVDGNGQTTLRGAYGLVLRRATHVALRHDQRLRPRRRHAAARLSVSRSAWPAGRCQGIVLPEGAVPLPRVTITIGPEAHTPRVHQVSGGVTRLLGASTAVSADVVYAHGLQSAGRARIQPDCAGTRSWPPAQRHRRDRRARPPTSRSSPTSARRGIAGCWCRRPAGSATAATSACPTRGRRPRTTSRATRARSTTTALGRNPADPNGLPLGFDPARERGPPTRISRTDSW